MQKGGVRISSSFLNHIAGNSNINKSPREEAIYHFLNYSSFEVLTNTSISCITLKATLNNNVESPFKSMRSNNIDLEVRCILLKIFITTPTTEDTFTLDTFITIQGRGYHNGIELTPISAFENEIKIQRDIYIKSFCSPTGIFDGICPAIIYYHKILDTAHISEFKALNSNGRMSTSDQSELNTILNILIYNQFQNKLRI